MDKQKAEQQRAIYTHVVPIFYTFNLRLNKHLPYTKLKLNCACVNYIFVFGLKKKSRVIKKSQSGKKLSGIQPRKFGCAPKLILNCEMFLLVVVKVFFCRGRRQWTTF